ncbi:MAG: DNA polymerase III subunit gamma/tau, partial [Pseudomonadota bacterium]
MSYQVLARKFRPGTFAGLVGQDHVVRALTHALDNDRLHHAYLFTGTRGVGKTTIARILAKSLNCEEGVSSTPCGVCSICQEVNENRFVDLIEVDAASRTRVDDTRELLENAQYLPTRGRYKVYLIDEVHMLSASSFNALLKTLEEPPEHVKFLLATTDPKKVPVTVLSRCLQFQLKNISPERTASYLAEILEQESIPFEAPALEVIGRAARGSMRDALSITDQAIGFGQGSLAEATVIEMLGLVGRDEVGALMDALAAGDAARLLAVVEELADRSVDFEALMADVLAALHAMAVGHALQTDARGPFDAETVQLLYQIGLLGFRDLGLAPDPKSGMEMTLLRMLTFAPDDAGQAVPPIVNDNAATPKGVAVPRETKPETEPRAEVAPSESVSATATDIADSPDTPAPLDQPIVAKEPRRNPSDSAWNDLVDALDLGGVARMLAEHSVAGLIAEDRVELILDPAHDTLLGDAQVQTIERALSEHF